MPARQTSQTVFTGNAQDLLAEYQRLREADRALQQERREQRRQSRELASEEKRRLSQAERLTREVITPQEQYRRKVDEVTAAYKRGDITQETYNRQLRLQRQNLNAATTAHGGLIRKITGLAAGYLSATAALNLFIQSNREAVQEAEKAGIKFDDMFRKFRVISGLRGLEAQQAQKRIEEIAVEFALPDVSQAEAGARQLVSSGASPEQASGDALRALLATLAVSTLQGKDVDTAGLVEGISQFLISQGQQVTGENIRRVGAGILTLSETALNFRDIPELAGVAAGFEGKLTEAQQFAAFATIRDVLPAAEGATGLRNIVNRLAASSAQPSRVRALEQIGLTPADVDFIGETGLEPLRRVQAGIQALPPEQRAAVQTQLFGERAINTARVLFNQLDQIEQRAAEFADTTAFEQTLKEATTGRANAARRQQLLDEILASRRDEFGDLVANELESELLERGASPARRRLVRSAFRTAQFAGGDPLDGALTAGLLFSGVTGVERGRQLRQDVEADVKLLQQGVDLQTATIEELRAMRQAIENNNPTYIPSPAEEQTRGGGLTQ